MIFEPPQNTWDKNFQNKCTDHLASLSSLIYRDVSISGVDSFIATLECSDHTCNIDLNIGSSQLENVLTVMQVPFQELVDMLLTLKVVLPQVQVDTGVT
jgi:hypothetical protein